jgi:Ca2+-binding RTX toxin-like protein
MRAVVRHVALVVVIALTASVAWVRVAPPAFAADPGVDTLVATLDGASNSLQAWTHDLATVGKLADALPAVQTSAGSVLGFADLLNQWFTHGTHKLHDAVTDDDLNFGSESIDLGGSDGRTGTLQSHLQTLGSGDKQLDITITASKTAHSQALTVPFSIGGNSNAPQSAFSSTGGVDLTVTGTLTFQLVWDHVANAVYVVADGSTTPSINVDAVAHLGTLSDIHAGIGILGVSVLAGSTLDLDAHFTATVSDPNNDGRLAFDNRANELASPGSLAGLVTIGFGTPAGALNAHLLIDAAGSTSGITLPSVNGTIDVSWPDISTGSPTVTPTGIDAAGKFLNLTPRDLADGIAQLATTLTSIQQSKIGAGGVLDEHGLLGNLDLPFVKGSLSDAIQLNEAIKKFLTDNTIDAATDPAQAGHPTFVSLQELLDRLNTATGLPGGATIGVSDVHWDDASSKLDFKITLHRAAPSTASDLSAAGAAASGGANTAYTTNTLTDNSAGHKPWVTDEFAGHHVVAGSSGGTIASNTGNTLTLLVPDPVNHPGEAWTPSVPVANSPYVISGGQGDLGTVDLGNSLQSAGHGIVNANAVNATAKVKPSYDASITLVLDLQPPTIHDPPLAQNNPDGSTTLVSATPTAANRILLRTAGSPTLFTADLPIDASIDILANAGFVKVELTGNAHVCNSQGTSADCTGTPTGHMLQVNLKDNGDLTFGNVVKMLLGKDGTKPGDLLDFDVNVRGAGNVSVSVPDAASFLPSPATASFHWNDRTQLTGVDGPTFDTSGLTDIFNIDFDPSNPKQLFAIILKTLQTLDKAIGDANPSGAGVFDAKIPVVGRSLRDLLRSDESGMGDPVTFGVDSVQDNSRSAANGNTFPQSLVGRSIVVGTQVGIIKTVTDNSLTMVSHWATQPSNGTPYIVRSELDDVISILQNSPSDDLQTMLEVVNNRLAHDTPISFAYEDDAKVGSVPSLVIKLDWKRAFHTSAPVQFDFDLPSLAGQKLAGVQGQGLVSLGASGEIKIGLVVPLAPGDGPADASALQLLSDSTIGAKLDASVEGSLATTIGPLSLSLGDPSSPDKARAKASYSIDLAKSGNDGSAETFDAFLGEVGPAVNASSNNVDCNLPDKATPTGLALCASLPLYVSTGSGYSQLISPSADPSCAPNCSDAFTIRLPKDTTPATDYFDFTGATIDGHPRLETPNADLLTQEILSHLIDLSRIDGIDGFLNLLVTSLNTASFGGKLPLIGDDLQQGADFLGNLKTAIDGAVGDLANVSDIAGLRDWVNNKLAAALTAANMNPDTVKVDTLCSSSLGSAGAPTVTPNPAGGTHTFSYAIVTYTKDSSGTKHDSTPGPDGTTNVANFTTIDGSHTNALSWGSVTGAAGYKVYRRDSGNLVLLKDVDTATSYTDDGTTDGAAPTNPSGPNPKNTDCDFSEFDSVLIRLDVSQGDFSGDLLNCPTAANDPHACLTEEVPLDIGIPGLSLRAADPSQGPKVEIGWRLHLAFGISRSEGFFVDTKDGDPQPEFAIGLNFTLPSQMQAQLAFINITADNCVKTDSDNCESDAPAPGNIPPLFGGSFKIDLKAPNDPTNGHLTLSDLSDASLDDLFSIELNASVNIDWLLKAKPGGGDAGFPGIQTELRLTWSWSHAFVGENDGSNGTPLSIQFLKVQIDAGEVFSHVLGPIINEIKKVTGPLDPVIKTLYAPIPVLSDLSHLVGGDDVTIVSIAKAFSTIAGGPDLTFVDTVTAMINFVNHIPTCTTSCLLPIGSFSVLGGKALDNTATPTNTDSLIDPASKKDKSGGTAFNSVLGDLDGKNSTSGATKLADPTGAAKAGFSFPVFDHPATLFNLIMGGDVDLVKFDSGPLTLGFDWRQEFGPVYAPPPVLITLHGSASVTLHIVAGFDTYGIRKAFEAARAGTLDLGSVGEAILQSLFFYTVDDHGKPIPVVSFHGEIAAGAEVSAVIIKVGIEGGVGLTISFLWNDPNNDGKFRISEFLQTALNNPICLFTVSGQIDVFLKLFVTIGFEPFAISFDFTIVDVTLLDFSVAPDCTPPPPQLAGLTGDGHTLIVFAGALGHAAQRGDAAYESDNEDKDSVKVISMHNYTDSSNNPIDPPTFKGIAIEMLGIRREFLNPDIQRVVVLGRGPGLTNYDKPMAVTFLGDGKADTSRTGGKPPTASFDKDAIVFGGNKNDNVKTGIGSSWVDGGDGDDTIVTGDRTVLNKDGTDYVLAGSAARVAGDGGSDSISVGNGDDHVWGDGSIPLTTTSVQLHQLNTDVDGGDPLGSDGHAGVTVGVPDLSSLGSFSSTASGSDGNDTIALGLGANNANGNNGNDVISVSTDSALAASKCSPAPAACMFRSAGDTLIGGGGNDNVAGGSGNDAIYSGRFVDPSDPSVAPDGNGTSDDGSTNVVDTGTGNDTVYGSTGEDRVTGHSTPTQHDDIRGGSANDILVGGYGTDKVFGGPGDDYVIAEPSSVDLGGGPPPDDGFGPVYTVTHMALPSGTDPSFKTLVGGTGRDHIIGGDGGANIDGDSYNPVTRCGPGATVASDPVTEANNASDGADKITGGTGVENVRAGGGDDSVDVKANNDLACGEEGNDTLIGGTGDDQVWGGSGNDIVNGGDGADSLYGNNGNDTIYGNNGNDTIEGNDGTDVLFGGANVDLVVGGTQAAGRNDEGDFLFGDSGGDILIGDNGVADGAGGGTPYDLGSGNAALGGGDFIFAGDGNDHAYGGLADDSVFGGTGDDYIEGNNGVDHLFGETGQVDIIGGTSQIVSGSPDALSALGYPDAGDVISGGDNEDVIIGDNGSISRPGAGLGSDFTQGRGMTERTVKLYDWANLDATRYGGDTITGDGANDAILGEGGTDTIHGNAGDDYVEGNQGADTIFGDAGQDDIIGGSSQVSNGAGKFGLTAAGEPDAGDTLLSGGDDQDVILGDNGVVLRTGTTGATTLTGTLEDVTKGRGMTQRRINLYDIGATTPGGGDTITGDGANDALFGEVGNDTVNGNDGDDYIEGDQATDALHGDAGQDDILGGGALVASGNVDAQTAIGEPDAGDTITGDVNGQSTGDPDVILGDNGSILRIGASDPAVITNTPDDAVKGHGGVTQRRIRLYDLPDVVPAANSGADDIVGQGGDDAVFGQGGNDRIKGGAADDHLVGGQASDFIEGDAGDDDIIGGSAIILATPGGPDTAQGMLDAGDVLYGGDGNDVELGDNGELVRVNPAGAAVDAAQFTTKFTNRLTPGGTGVVTTRWLRRLDTRVGGSLLTSAAGRSGDDRISGGNGVDMLFGQDGNDLISGGPDDDYAEGGGGNDVIRGDKLLTDASPTNVVTPTYPSTTDQNVDETTIPALVDNWVGTAGPAADLEGASLHADGQDDLIGGSSIQAFRDGNDTIEGDGEADFQLGDNGALVRDYGAPDGNGIRHYVVATKRYATGAVPDNAVIVRHHDPTIPGMTTTRFCTTAQATCEPTGTFGADTMYGDGGEDTMWAQDGNDAMRGGAGNDDMYGELGDDVMLGDGGQDAMVGDRGGIVDTYINGTNADPAFASPYTVSVNAPPAISYSAFIPGTYDRRADLLHDIDGEAFVGSGTTNVMPHDGVNEGGIDHMRGGTGHDTMHGGQGDDVMNGDSGGDTLFGDDGADVIWGGKGCDPNSVEDDDPNCGTDPSSFRGANDKFVDYTFGGKGGTSQTSLKGDAGADILDWQPRGSYPTNCSTDPWPQTLSKTATVDPCDWFLMTNTYNDGSTPSTDASHRDNQTHSGIDWMYGGWDRDIMQADQADEGPNTGDRLLDWNGAYNLYSHCNPSYGGFNDVRQLSPAELTFIQQWSYGVGIGQKSSDVTTPGTSAYDEVAIVYQSDIKSHGAGADFPTTPGHFDAPNACSY